MLKLYYRNVLDKVIGKEGIGLDNLKEWQGKIANIIRQLNEETKAGHHRYRRLPEDKEMADKAFELAEKIKERCKNFVVLGIGGSALGNIALQTALNHPYYNLLPNEKRKGPRLFVMDNVDPVQFEGLLEFLEPELNETVFNVISKSGETAETAAQFLIVRGLIRKRFGEDKLCDHIVVTTDPQKGTLKKIAEEDRYPTLEVPEGVGGRFSVLSHVGLLSAAVCNIDIYKLLDGAREANKRISCEDLFKNPAAMYALIQYLFYKKGKKISVMMPYSYQLKDLCDWYRQLWAESLGKENALDGSKVNIGPTPIKALGTTDQHSQIQLYREGPNDKVITFLEVEEFNKEAKIPQELTHIENISYLCNKSLAELINKEKYATEFALAESKRPTLTVIFPQIDEFTVGEFILIFEFATSIAGKLFNINAYDQPAVELGKKATFALMNRRGYENIAENLLSFVKKDEQFII